MNSNGRTGTSRSHTSNIVSKWMTENVWCTKTPPSLLNIHVRLTYAQQPLHARLTTMYLRHHGSRSRQSYHGGSGNQPLWDLLLNESQNQRYDYCVHHYLRNNPMRKTQILCRISDRVTLGNLSNHEGKGSENVTWKLNSGGSKLYHSYSISFNLSSVEELF